MAALLARVLTTRAAVWVIVAGVMSVAAGAAGQASPPAFDKAVRVLAQAQRSCGTGPVQEVSLPDEVKLGRDDSEPVECNYRLRFNGEPRGFGIFIPRLSAHAIVDVNANEMSNSALDPMLPNPRSVDRIVLLEVPEALWHTGDNTIEIHASGPRVIALSKVQIGPIEQLKREHRARVLSVVIGPSLVAAVVGTLGLCMVLLWVRRRDGLYGYFGAGTFFWGLHTLWTVSPWSPINGSHLTVWWTSLYTCFVAMLIIFCVRFAEWDWPKLERALWVIPVVAPIVMYASIAWDKLGLASELVRLLLLGMVGLGVIAVIRASIRRLDVDKALVLASAIASFGFGVHDWLAELRDDGDNPIYLVPYAGLIFVVFVVRMLIDRFARTTQQLEVMNTELGQRVATQTAELHDAVEKMREARDAAEAADHAKTRFLAAASHDLRQPAHALALYMAALRSERLEPTQADLVERMSGSLSALETMFNMLLDVSRIDAGALTPVGTTFAIEPMLRQLAEEFAPQAEAQGLRLALRLPSATAATPAFAHSDRLLVERIVRNLLANAVKYTFRGGVLLACRRRSTWPANSAAAPAPAHWRIEVWDTGVGLGEADKQRVFEEFFQVDNPSRDRAKGLGLGLSIVHRLVKLLGLHLILYSRLGRGTCFTLYLPQASSSGAAAVERSPVAPASSVAGLTVGVIEDDIEVRDAMRILLQRWGCRVVEGADADDLELHVNEADCLILPEAILVDQRLGAGKTGPEEAGLLFERWGTEIPMLVVTGESDLALIKAAGHACLAKPISPTLLRNWLASVRVLPSDPATTALNHAHASGDIP